MDLIYVETTVIGNVAGRIHSNPDVASRQRTTRTWWTAASNRFELAISQLVVDECSDGDPAAAQERLDVISDLTVLTITDDARALARLLNAEGAVPPSEPRDALHIAVAAVQRVQYLVTWNFTHIANATMRSKIEQTCRDAGFIPPIICSPPEIPADNDD
ncbi:MAG TPA: type II toxin-antitoxin system VapC family toxin [Pirellulaceae bacterium]|nr:type II toxin-antitoxin system VapC family toxin [Pirellulaceae bacterium]